MSGVGPFVEVEALVVAWLVQQLPGVEVTTDLPPDIEGQQLIRVTRSPGSNTEMSAYPRVDVEAFAPDRASMWQLIGRANDAIARICGATVNGVQVDAPSTVTDPISAWWSPTVMRAVAVYELELRVLGVTA